MDRLEQRNRLYNKLIKANKVKRGELDGWVSMEHTDENPFLILDILKDIKGIREKVLNRQRLSIADTVDLLSYVEDGDIPKPLHPSRVVPFQTSHLKPGENINESRWNSMVKARYDRLTSDGIMDGNKIPFWKFKSKMAEIGLVKGLFIYAFDTKLTLENIELSSIRVHRTEPFGWIQFKNGLWEAYIPTHVGGLKRRKETLEELVEGFNEGLEKHNPLGREPFTVEDIYFMAELYKNRKSRKYAKNRKSRKIT